jgi:hypothetical protein
VFTNKSIELKPKKNSLLVFSSTGDNAHKVNPVTSGSKYVVASFLS